MKRKRMTRIVFLVSACLLPLFVYAEVKMPSILSDNMVLQSESKVKLWGKADAGEHVMVSASWSRKPLATTIADRYGRWSVRIDTPKAMRDQSITVRASNTIYINNVLIGEVWMCSGQSNMEFPVAHNPQIKWHTGMIGEEKELSDADYPEIRLFHIEHQLAPKVEQDDCKGRWMICSNKSVKNFSAVGFVFGKELHKVLNVPIGLIQATWGGTTAEAWTSADVMQGDTLYNDALTKYRLDNIKRNKDYCKIPATLWNGMIHPVAGYKVRGCIWYQGESNSDRAWKYRDIFENMIEDWRHKWDEKDMPFYFVQIAPHYRQPAEIREAQLDVWQKGRLKNIGMAVITDAGDSTDIHPRNKRITGERLARWALAKQYGKKIAFSGPLYKSMKVKGNRVTLYFDFAGNRLKTPAGEPVRGFFIAGADARFYPAQAVIKGTTVELTASEVPHPVAVRYGWGTFFRINLYNDEGLPAVPFRTDSFAPEKMSRRFADSEMRRFPQAWQLDHGKRLFFGYAQGVGCCSMLAMWKATGDRRYYDYVQQWGDTLINNKGEIWKYDMSIYNLDFINSGKVLFELYSETGNEKYYKAMDLLIRQLSRHPRTLEGGYWHKLLYQHQMWLDGLYMASPFMAQYGATFNKPEWIDEAVKQLQLCHKHTYDAATGLYYHAWDESRSQRWANPETGHSPNFWGRSIGWWFMALVDVLDYVPVHHEARQDLIGYIRGLADALSKYQDKSGLWYQVIDQPKRKDNFPEASVTAQCMYAYAKAVNKEYIAPEYRTVAEKAFYGIKDKLLRENPDGTLTLTRCCQVGGLGGSPYRDGSFKYYISEKIRDNDAKATGPYIMGCLELGQ